MKAIEFKTKIRNNQIEIPVKVQSELRTNKDIRVIVFIDDSEIYDKFVFKELATSQFIQGYANSDSIYDNY